MNLPHEIVLSTIGGATDKDRLLVVLCNQSGESRLELRQQSFGDGIGWFTQSTVALEPSQVAELRSALGTGGNRGPSPLPKSFRRAEQPAWQPRVVRADVG
jgi:hypothetical protein